MAQIVGLGGPIGRSGAPVRCGLGSSDFDGAVAVAGDVPFGVVFDPVVVAAEVDGVVEVGLSAVFPVVRSIVPSSVLLTLQYRPSA